MMSFLYETHLHTRCASLCSSADPKGYVHLYQDAGFSGLIVTDHFFNGNCRLKSGTWREKVNQFVIGYEKAAEEGFKRGFDVFFGWESTYDGDDYLIYGLDKAWLLLHPEIVSATREQQFRLVHDAGGAVIHAHPFRERDYINAIHLAPSLVDGVEVANAQNERVFDQRAFSYAKKHNLFMTAGSDIHHLRDVGSGCYGMISSVQWKGVEDYVRAIKEHSCLQLHCPSDCFVSPTGEPDLPIVCEH